MKVVCRLKEIMDSQGITQMALAEKTGLAISTIGRMYRNNLTRYDEDTIVALCEHFNLQTISELIEIER